MVEGEAWFGSQIWACRAVQRFVLGHVEIELGCIYRYLTMCWACRSKKSRLGLAKVPSSFWPSNLSPPLQSNVDLMHRHFPLSRGEVPVCIVKRSTLPFPPPTHHLNLFHLDKSLCKSVQSYPCPPVYTPAF